MQGTACDSYNAEAITNRKTVPMILLPRETKTDVGRAHVLKDEDSVYISRVHVSFTVTNETVYVKQNGVNMSELLVHSAQGLPEVVRLEQGSTRVMPTNSKIVLRPNVSGYTLTLKKVPKATLSILPTVNQILGKRERDHTTEFDTPLHKIPRFANSRIPITIDDCTQDITIVPENGEFIDEPQNAEKIAQIQRVLPQFNSSVISAALCSHRHEVLTTINYLLALSHTSNGAASPIVIDSANIKKEPDSNSGHPASTQYTPTQISSMNTTTVTSNSTTYQNTSTNQTSTPQSTTNHSTTSDSSRLELLSMADLECQLADMKRAIQDMQAVIAEKDKTIKHLEASVATQNEQINILTGGYGWEAHNRLKRAREKEAEEEANSECNVCFEKYSFLRPRHAMPCRCPKYSDICTPCAKALPNCPFCRKSLALVLF